MCIGTAGLIDFFQDQLELALLQLKYILKRRPLTLDNCNQLEEIQR